MSATRRWWALAAIMLSMLTIGFDATILNVALPTLATALRAGTDGLQWIVNAYTLVFAGLLLPMGALGDRYGRKRLLLVGLALFGGASVVATYAGSVGALIAARALMGLAAAVLTPIGMAVLPVMFAPHERAKAISYAAIGMGVGVPLGPIIGGYLLRHFWWGSIFLVNVPVVVFALLAIGALVPESRDPAPRRVDALGGALSTLGLIGFVYGVIEVPRRGWGDLLVVGSIAIGVALLVAFVVRERRTAEPMIDLWLFTRPRFLWGGVAMTVASFALFGLLFVLPQYLQDVRGNDALGTGVRLLPMMAGLIVGSRVSEVIGRSLGEKVPVTAGLLVIAGGLALGATTGVDSGYGLAASWLSIVGLGTGLTLAPAMDAVLGDLPPERAGAGSALTMALRQVGGALGVALLGSLLAGAYADRVVVAGLPRQAADAVTGSVAGAVAVAGRLHDTVLEASARAAYVRAMDLVLVACGSVALLGAVLAAVFLPARATPPVPERDRITVR
ncbi:DHA2 family efflux MFS transporter permease subunit [Planosporangium thailandense]|uniref:DHA2 family efflux MFS transporter permease subunit n=1 Tax=Planosporangium thailandense TaxID=765197 RepID=A0ABX0Y433_9ACTN|nr:DHA2 family efflux MFS transporter permease subunit [Planosporangium thailandense]NJC72836.1 DHA2 family efflux MFS transporter permease subunit [Planosporangium thailandense]